MNFEKVFSRRETRTERKEVQEIGKPSFFTIGKKTKGIALALAAGFFTGCTSKVEGFGVVSPDGLKKTPTAAEIKKEQQNIERMGSVIAQTVKKMEKTSPDFETMIPGEYSVKTYSTTIRKGNEMKSITKIGVLLDKNFSSSQLSIAVYDRANGYLEVNTYDAPVSALKSGNKKVYAEKFYLTDKDTADGSVEYIITPKAFLSQETSKLTKNNTLHSVYEESGVLFGGNTVVYDVKDSSALMRVLGHQSIQQDTLTTVLAF